MSGTELSVLLAEAIASDPELVAATAKTKLKLLPTSKSKSKADAKPTAGSICKDIPTYPCLKQSIRFRGSICKDMKIPTYRRLKESI